MKKHTKQFATEVAVLSVGLLAGVQMALPLWQGADEQGLTAFFTTSHWTGAVSSAGPMRAMPPMVTPPMNGTPMGDMPQTMIAPINMGNGSTDSMMPPMGMPGMVEPMHGAAAEDVNAVKQERDSAKQEADALRMQLQMLQQELETMRAAAAQPEPTVTDTTMQAATVVTDGASSEPVISAEPMAMPVDESASIWCRWFGIGCDE
jgi:hypothetical protein